MKKTTKVRTTKGSVKGTEIKQAEGTSKLLRSSVARLLQRLGDSAKAGKCGVGGTAYYIGLDLGDRQTHYCILDESGEIAAAGQLATTAEEFEAYFRLIPKSRLAMEVGTHSPWLDALLKELGHEVYVANVRKMEGGKKRRRRKNDKVDAQRLARLVKADPRLLYPIQHRGAKARQGLMFLRLRDALVSSRTKLITCIRGSVKSAGQRLPSCSAEVFHKRVRERVPEELREALAPMFEQIGKMTEQIQEYDKQVERLCAEAYPETQLCRQVKGVGAVTSLAYVLTLENPARFAKSRDVGAYLGLVPQQYDSGDSTPQLRITKTGDRMLRRLLVGSAQYILGPFGEDCDLRRYGLKLAARGGKNAKKRAVVAVARKLGVLLHRLWATAEVYEPLRNSKRLELVEAAAAH